jgi:hypothetical protein
LNSTRRPPRPERLTSPCSAASSTRNHVDA